MRVHFLYAVCLLLLHCNDAAKILFVSPSLSKSIVMFCGRVADTLAEAGHDVTFWIPEMRPHDGLVVTRLAKVVRMDNLSRTFDTMMSGEVDFLEDYANVFANRLEEDTAMVDHCESILIRKEELEGLRRENFDLAFSDLNDLCTFGLVHYLGIEKHIWINTGLMPDGISWLLGIPHPVSYVPTLQDNLLGPSMNFWERAENIFMYSFSRLSALWFFRQENVIFKKYVSPDFPPLEDLARKVSLAFVAGDEFLNAAVPTLEKVVYIGGIGIESPRPLKDEGLLKMLNKGRAGAVFFSLGSATQTKHIGAAKKKALFQGEC